MKFATLAGKEEKKNIKRGYIMKVFTFTKNGYRYNELADEAKAKVKSDYLSDSALTDSFTENIIEELSFLFPNSDLKVSYSLNYCQGDGLNIHGVLKLYDFIAVWEATEKEKSAIRYYIDNSENEYTFNKNNHYCYSCKFIDKKYVDGDIEEFIDYLSYYNIRGINKDLIKRFFNDMIDYFQELDEKWEQAGYKYFYEIDDESIIEWAEANDYYFDECGEII